MKKFTIPAFAIMLFTLNSCKQCNVKKPGFDNAPLVVTIVLCDLTKSVDSTAIDRIADHAVQLYTHAPDRTELYYYSIGPNDYNEFIGKFYKKLPLRENETQKEKRLKQIANDDTVLSSKINYLYRSEAYQKTCITHALKTAYDLLKEKSSTLQEATLNIVVLSDMAEDCNHHLLGNIKMLSTSDLKKAQEVIKSAPSTGMDLQKANINLYLICESQGEAFRSKYSRDAVSRHEIESAWSQILSKFGYAQNSDLVKFEWQRIPENLITE